MLGNLVQTTTKPFPNHRITLRSLLLYSTFPISIRKRKGPSAPTETFLRTQRPPGSLFWFSDEPVDFHDSRFRPRHLPTPLPGVLRVTVVFPWTPPYRLWTPSPRGYLWALVAEHRTPSVSVLRRFRSLVGPFLWLTLVWCLEGSSSTGGWRVPGHVGGLRGEGIHTPGLTRKWVFFN